MTISKEAVAIVKKDMMKSGGSYREKLAMLYQNYDGMTAIIDEDARGNIIIEFDPLYYDAKQYVIGMILKEMRNYTPEEMAEAFLKNELPAEAIQPRYELNINNTAE